MLFDSKQSKIKILQIINRKVLIGSCFLKSNCNISHFNFNKKTVMFIFETDVAHTEFFKILFRMNEMNFV